MNLNAVFTLLAQAQRLCGHSDFVVIGSLSVLALEPDCQIPADMTLSIDLDCYTRNDPPRVFEVLAELGENSAYHIASGVYLDGVSPNLATLPEAWQNRLIGVERGNLRAWFLDPVDAAVSKYARGEPRDQRWIRAGIAAGIISLPLVQQRLKTTRFLDDAEQSQTFALVEADQRWFDGLRSARSGRT